MYTVFQKTDEYFVFINSVKNEPILIVFGRQNPEKKLEISDYNFVHHTSKMYSHCALRNSQR